MGKGGKVESKQHRNRRGRSKEGSDESDEDYTVGEDEEFHDSEEYCSLAGEESEESLGDFEEEEEEEEEEEPKVSKIGRSKGEKAFPDRRKIEVGKAFKKTRTKVEDDEDFEVEEYDDDEAHKKRLPKIEDDEDFEVEECDNDWARKKRRSKVEDDEDFEVEDYEIGRSKGQKVFPDQNEVGKARKKRRAKVEDEEDFEVEEYEDNGARKKRRPKAEDDEDFEVEEYEDNGARKNKRPKLEDDEDFEVQDYDDDDDDDEDEEEEEEEEEEEGQFAQKRRASYRVKDDEDLEDEDFDDDDDDDDEEFAPDDIDLDNEDELKVRKKNKKVGRRPLWENGHVKKRKRKRSSRLMEKPIRKNRTKNLGLQRKSAATNGGTFTGKNPVVKERSKKSSGRRRRKFMADPDSDFTCSGSSDYEYSVSEEEREQVREASTFCRDLTISLRNPSSTKRIQEGVSGQQRKRSGRKGKEKLEEVKIEVGKQVCGICLSEEGKTTVRGTLNCCTHYFCFGCIMEWSKVESRCPLCKQRFVTISKPARSNAAFDLRTVVVQVPERDQVYQPSEEELRGYLDPYESVICTECHQGGEDAFMLLCDICDSPAHTFCIGLGREVPEGNWYCEGCRPIALSYSNPQAPNLTPEQRTYNNPPNRSIPDLNVREAIDLNSEYVPESPSTQSTGVFLSPRHPVGDSQAGSPVSGVGVSTLSQRRRFLQLHHVLNNRFVSRTNWASAASSGSNILGSQIEPERLPSQQTISQRILPGNFTASAQRFPLSWATSSRSRDQQFRGRTSTSGGGSVNRMIQAGLSGMSSGINSRSGYEQLHPCSTSRSSIAEDSMAPYGYREVSHFTSGGGSVNRMIQAGLSGMSSGINSRSGYEQLHPCSTSRSSIVEDSMAPYGYREVSHFNAEKEQVRSMVRSHLKSLSIEMGLGDSTFKDIARYSTHTILAACGLQHRGSHVYPVQPPSICDHVDEIARGEISLMKGFCSSCFDSFVMYVVREITNTSVRD
ncbi:hypothetical protein RHGRI_031917 [Rhododendron griersonianum]|uniref:Uncharacterized protein n=1 Tax=Rhododendron griersonianum TaxID=479676 RepID=A0AAV6I9N1_9ERIC|nr:hypothetical protein RHGRI_031917 [Rhododendron griersonianum]KAG5525416.1 hypothetical protein RHGRI_031917 [Rhododendron griersonianum]KAG5525417.1 hypothetical protein RHGRI_031917 [Rhododendron griersonianum]KAG5525418.1 hypothetical protein RHGRI_031917 [Rhododendron griersonianum]